MTAAQTQSDVNQPSDMHGMADQYLTFLLDGEEYAVEILQVQEIKGWDAATPVPNTPDYVLGVINLRGSVVPVVDLRKRFNLDNISFGPTTVIIVVKVVAEESERTVGIVVDAVSEVYRFNRSEVQPPPDLGNAIGTEFVRGLVAVDDKMVILLEIDQLINSGVLDIPAEPADEGNSIGALPAYGR